MSKFAWGLFLILTFLITLPASWWALAKVDFAYGVLHDTMNISAHVDQYAPKNSFNKKHFELTTKAEREVLFHQVIVAIQSNGQGLKKITYHDKKQQKPVTLFTHAEVVHLEDVAHLLNKLSYLALGLFVFWLVLLLILWRRKISLPRSKQLLISTTLILLVAGFLLLLGPEAIFNQLHIWVFPDNHQWFFYYEESLMTVLMKAPDLFAYIALEWFLLSLVFTSLLMMLLRKGLVGSVSQTPPRPYRGIRGV